MGSWGVGIEEDDDFLDVYGEIEQAMKEGASLSEACARVIELNQARLEDDLAGPVVWLAVAKAQWTYGRLEPEVLDRVRSDVESDRGMELWLEAGQDVARARRAALVKFLQKVSAPRPSPKRPPRRTLRRPNFAAGDCLSIRHPDGRFGAAIVTAADDTHPEMGMNLVCTLTYLGSTPTTERVFEDRVWLRLTRPPFDGSVDCMWFYPMGFRTVKSRLEVVARTELRASDPRSSKMHGTWKLIGSQALQQAEWERER